MNRSFSINLGGVQNKSEHGVIYRRVEEKVEKRTVDQAYLQFKLKSKLINKFKVDTLDEPVEALDLRLTKFEDDYSNVENPLIEIKQEVPSTAEADHNSIKVEAPTALDYSEVEQVTLRDSQRSGRPNYLHPDYSLPSSHTADGVLQRIRKLSNEFKSNDLDSTHHHGIHRLSSPPNMEDGDLRSTRTDYQRVVLKPSHRRKSPNPRYSPYEIRRGYNPSTSTLGDSGELSHLQQNVSSSPPLHHSSLSQVVIAAARGSSSLSDSHHQRNSSFPMLSLSPPPLSNSSQYMGKNETYHRLSSPGPGPGDRDRCTESQQDQQQDVQHFSLSTDRESLMRRSPLFAQMLANSRGQVIRSRSPEHQSHYHSNPLDDNIPRYNSLGLSHLDFDKNQGEKNFDDISETADDISKNYDNPLLMSNLGKYSPKLERPDTPLADETLSTVPMSPHRRQLFVREQFYSKESEDQHNAVYNRGGGRGEPPSAGCSSHYMSRQDDFMPGNPRRLSNTTYERQQYGDMLDKHIGWNRSGHQQLPMHDRVDDHKFIENKRYGQVPGFNDLDGMRQGVDQEKRLHHERPSVLARANASRLSWPQQQHSDMMDYDNKDMTSISPHHMRKFRTEDLSISHSADYHRSVIVKHNSTTDSVEKDEQPTTSRRSRSRSPSPSSNRSQGLPFNDRELHGLLKLQAAAKLRIENMINSKSGTMQAGSFLNNLHMNPYLRPEQSTAAFPGALPPFPGGAGPGGSAIKREPHTFPYDHPHSHHRGPVTTSDQLGMRRYGDHLNTSPIPSGMPKQLSPLGGQYASQLQGDEVDEDDHSLAQKGKRGRPRKHAPKIPLPPLYVFIRNMLHNRAYNPSVVAWVDEETGCFKVNSTTDFAKTWGNMKANRSEEMTYEKMSRAMRYHYGSEKHGRKGHLAMVKEKRLYYRFGELAVNWSVESMAMQVQIQCNIHPLCRNQFCLWSKE